MLGFGLHDCGRLAGPITANALTCGDVFTSLTPCVTYLRIGGSIPTTCCFGLRSLKNAARTTPDRQTACKCLKQAANSFGSVSRSNVVDYVLYPM
ncbi:unnamed protein product [Microthlaspi erraticum]|uniref:Non-specific lipid-transfer protein n=1 Tax=Microthlaspi erraticum TaxID=1685480 RepID=A0A6D2KY09_9BRAS|nr:unnamed protein product [Microthlaspi erraticum]